eukprot:TRINITY_DN21703_c0_g1_i1.p1 TRINITY_DN21703_c0_g1~~TRINITY_DN21703_c0_g1_i1.p1  ORF type:complete len:859 (+),score=103.77 TRINITY_DN21703_c0_g1_i1:77-2653(+)
MCAIEPRDLARRCAAAAVLWAVWWVAALAAELFAPHTVAWTVTVACAFAQGSLLYLSVPGRCRCQSPSTRSAAFAFPGSSEQQGSDKFSLALPKPAGAGMPSSMSDLGASVINPLFSSRRGDTTCGTETGTPTLTPTMESSPTIGFPQIPGSTSAARKHMPVQYYEAGTPCCVVAVSFADAGIGCCHYDSADALSVLASGVRALTELVSKHGGRLHLLDPFDARMVFAFIASECGSDVQRSALAFCVALPAHHLGLPLRAAAAGPSPIRSDFTLLGCGALLEAAMLLRLGRVASRRLLVASRTQPHPGLKLMPTVRGSLWYMPSQGLPRQELHAPHHGAVTARELAAAVWTALELAQAPGSASARAWRHSVAAAEQHLDQCSGELLEPDAIDAVKSKVQEALKQPEAADAAERIDWSSHVDVAPHVTLGYERAVGEDAWFIVPDLRIFELGIDPGLSLCGVFDGHGGTEAALYARAQYPPEVARLLAQGFSPSAALYDALLGVDRRFAIRAAKQGIDSGCTASVVLTTPDTIYVCSLGDSRVVAARPKQPGRWGAESLSRDHQCTDPLERGAVEVAGGTVLCCRGAPRVDGQLCISRAMGDRGLRSSLRREPDVCVRSRSDLDFVVLASDGLWAVADNDEVVQLVGASRTAVDSGDYGSTIMSSSISSRPSARLARPGSPQFGAKRYPSGMSSVAHAHAHERRVSHTGDLGVRTGTALSVPFTDGSGAQGPTRFAPLPSPLPTLSHVTSGSPQGRMNQSVRSKACSELSYSAIPSGLAVEARDRMQQKGQHVDDVTVVVVFLATSQGPEVGATTASGSKLHMHERPVLDTPPLARHAARNQSPPNGSEAESVATQSPQ